MPYLINTSFIVDPTIRDPWAESLRKHYIPALRAAGFGKITLSQLLSEQNEAHFTYSLLIEVPDIESYQKLIKVHFADYATTASELWGDRLLWFNSLLKQLDESE